MKKIIMNDIFGGGGTLSQTCCLTHQIGSCKLFSSTLIKKPGFTLAEVLITLGIIGVVTPV